jgi:SWI/SNF-related matrix-associated actin-dependent regulator of chromatin subfamily A3
MPGLGKRQTEWVDLTSSSPPPQQKKARVNQPITPPASSQPAASQSLSQRNAWNAGHNNEENDIIDLSQDINEGFGWVDVGAINTKIVGVRFYNGYATPGEQVMVKREPGNPYDSNAIRINNVQGTQIGHIGRDLAGKLAPYLVSLRLLIWDTTNT